MVTLKTKYIILIWIIILILFTFYCIIRMGYLREKYDNVLLKTITTQPNIISYINNIQAQKDITDMPGCSNVYDDNFAVQALGYNTCQNAYADYLAKNLDVKSKYGQTKSLEDICPVSTKTEKYSQCLQSLMTTFTDNANILDTITSDMNTYINKRVSDRNAYISGIETAINPLIYNKDQVDFNNNMQINGQIPKYQSDKLLLVNQYYANRYRGGFEGFNNNILSPYFSGSSSGSSSGLSSGTSVPSNLSPLILDPLLMKNFFGIYKTVKGQFTSLNNTTITLGYDTSSSLTPTITVNNLTVVSNPAILLTIDNISLQITYTVNYLENYKALPNVIKLNLIDKNVVVDTNQFQSQQDQSIIVQQLLSILGINVPSRLIMTYEDITSPENITHRQYKIVNDNLDTILVLNKIQ